VIRAVAILVLVWAAVPSKPPPPTPTEASQAKQDQTHTQRGEAQRDNRPTENPPPAVQRSNPEVAVQYDKHFGKEDKGHASPDWPSWAVAFFTFGLFVTAVFQWLAMHGQRKLMAGQLASMKTTGDDTHELALAAKSQIELLTKHVEAAKLAADSAHNSVLVAFAQSNIAKLDQRAWVGVVGVMHTPLTPNRPFEVGVDIMNSGKTPAKGKTAIRVRMLRVFEKPELKDATWAPMSTRSHGIFFPNALCHIRNYVRAGVEMSILTEADIATIKVGVNSVFVDGRIDYVDVFGHSHWTEFRYVWNTFQDVFTQCSEGNSTDDEWTPLGEVVESDEERET
jgi:hypothetical protein